MGMFSRRSKGFTYYRRENRFRKRLSRFLVFLLLLYLVFQAVALIIVTPYRITGSSMEPTIPAGGKSLAIPMVYGIQIPFTHRSIPGFGRPRRGDIVICTPPTHTEAPWYLRIADSVSSFFTLGKVRIAVDREQVWDSRLAVKRIIGIPGDTIRLETYEASIRPEGKQSFFSEFDIIQKNYDTRIDPLPENWLPEFPFSGTLGEITLGDNEYFLLGDNRTSSKDSSIWGPVDRGALRARIMVSYLPGFRLH